MKDSEVIKLIEKAEDIPTLPVVATKVVSITTETETSVKEVANLIEKDMALSAKILQVINSPFYDFLSEKVEEIYLGQSFEEKWSWEYIKRNILTPIKESLKLVLWELGITILLFVVSIISAGLGTVLFALAGPYLASLTVFDFVMARKIYTLAEKRQYLHSNLAFIMGFGTPTYFAPFLIPFAVVGSTLAYMASRHK